MRRGTATQGSVLGTGYFTVGRRCDCPILPLARRVATQSHLARIIDAFVGGDKQAAFLVGRRSLWRVCFLLAP